MRLLRNLDVYDHEDNVAIVGLKRLWVMKKYWWISLFELLEDDLKSLWIFDTLALLSSVLF